MDLKSPLYIRLHRNPVADIYQEEDYKFEFGKSENSKLLYRNHGMDVDSIVAKAVALKLRKENK